MNEVMTYVCVKMFDDFKPEELVHFSEKRSKETEKNNLNILKVHASFLAMLIGSTFTI